MLKIISFGFSVTPVEPEVYIITATSSVFGGVSLIISLLLPISSTSVNEQISKPSTFSSLLYSLAKTIYLSVGILSSFLSSIEKEILSYKKF